MFVGFLIRCVLCESCEAPNTVKSQSGSCVCMDGFPYGDPNSSNGCWKCDSACGRNAACQYPGVCKCNPFYVGDGFSCQLDLPEIVDFSPESGPGTGGTNVTIHYKFSRTLVSQGYCRFGRYSVIGTVDTDKHSLVCLSPPGASHVHPLSISFDGIAWSKDNTFFKYVDSPDGSVGHEKTRKQWILVCIGILSILFVISLIEKKPKEKSESLNPLLAPNEKRRHRGRAD